MRFFNYHIILLIAALFASNRANAQRNCGTVEYMNQLGNTETKDALEDWILQKQIEAPSSSLKSFNEDGITVYQIPVVVHIVHNGEAIGVGSNISELQIQSQIDVLNEDFRKLNADSINIPSEFKSLYANIGFEFILAKRDPSSAATNGITRIQGSKPSWNINSADNTELKSHDYWPSEDYLNIWVAPLCCGWLGWAQFPQSDILAGLDPPYNDTTDGVVITYDAFGSISKDPTANLQSRFDLGRTATHEIGHFFGLRHIWGDGGCGADDYINDTPLAEDNYTGCPTLGASSTTCDSQQDMFMNYMDYTDDRCMNIFSLGQKDRMVIIMENSPRRLSLTQSAGLLPPNSDDLALLSFTSPKQGICDDQISPSVLIKNVGISNINSANISLYINDNLVTTQDFTLGLVVNEITELFFSPINLTSFGNIEFKAIINTTNGNPDTSIENNTLSTTSLRAESISYLSEDFSTSSSSWTVRTSEESSSLEKSQSVFYNTTNNSAAFNFYKSEPSTDSYISPKLLVANSSTLFFDYAYAYRGLEDEFSVWLSTDCGNTFDALLFLAVGKELSTANSPVAFYPSGAQDWQHVQIDLSAYANQEVIFSFNGKSDGGNRILFDNIRVENQGYNDIALLGLVSPATNCGLQNEVLIEVENKGTVALTDLILESTLNATTSTITYPQLNLLPGERIRLTMPTESFEGKSQLSVSISDDDNNENNQFVQSVLSVSSIGNVPLREKFEGDKLTNNWALVGNTENNNLGWQLNNNQLEFITETSTAKGLHETIVLPPLSLTDLTSAAMHFDFAYAYDGFNEELLKVRATKDCGETYETLFIEGGEELATNFTTTSWFPNGSSDWKNIYVDLSEFAGNENVQIIIELTSAKGNNAFVNNIELYASNIITPLELADNTITAYPNPSSSGTINISFNLNKSQPAKMLIYNAQGSFVYEEDITNALNQTFEVSTTHLQNGIYFARVVSNQLDLTSSFIVNN